MTKNIDPQLCKIEKYLSLDEDAVFEIPEYQRAYSWGISQCDKLWNDVVEFSESDDKDNYFFGTIIINCQDNDTKNVLIDGQQRTTTFLLLLKALLIRINDAIIGITKDEESEKLYSGLQNRRKAIIKLLYGLDLDDINGIPDRSDDAAIYKRKIILLNKSINEQYYSDLANILSAVDYEEAEERVMKIPRKQKNNKYTNYFRNFQFFYECANLKDSKLNVITKTIIEKCELIVIRSWQVEQAITMFNSLNSDGLPLFDADIISAKMFASAEKMGKSENFKKLWEEIKNNTDGLERREIADIDSILMQYMYYERAKRREILSETGAINVTTPGVRRYYTDLNKELIGQSIDTCEKLLRLTSMWEEALIYPCVQILLKLNDNARLFFASYLCGRNDNVDEQEIKVLAESLLRLFAILELVDIGYSSKYFKTFLFGENVKIVDENISVQEIEKDFMNHINYNWENEKDNLRNAIEDYNNNALVYLNEYLYAKENRVSFNLQGKYDIEHIMPNSGKNLQIIRQDAKIENENEFKLFVNKIGNKILLEEKINRSIGNEWFRTKVSTKLEDKTGYINSRYPIAGDLVEKYKNDTKPLWTKEDILSSTKKAEDRIEIYI